MKTKIMILLITALISLTGCNKNGIKNASSETETATMLEENLDKTENKEEDTNEMVNDSSVEEAQVLQKVTAEEFMYYYSLSEEDVPVEYVQSFIDEYDITYDDMKKGGLGYVLLTSYENGETFGHDVDKVFKGPRNQDPLIEYIEQTEVIEFSFGMHYGSEKASSESMVIDLKERKIYYTRGSEVDYTKFELSSELTTEDVESIRETLPTHIAEDKGQADFGGYGNYTFRIKMVATDETTKYYEGNQGDEEYFPGFDKYWKNLYKTYFGEPYKYIRN